MFSENRFGALTWAKRSALKWIAITGMALAASTAGAVVIPNAGVDTVFSIGKFQIQFDDGTLFTSGYLIDNATKIGRSDTFSHGDGTDLFDLHDVAHPNGADICTAGTTNTCTAFGAPVVDGDFTKVPAGFQGPAGTTEVHTAILDLTLKNDPNFPTIIVSLNPAFRSIGEVESLNTPAGEFPAQSFFNVFVNVTVAGIGTFYNLGTDPLLIEGTNLLGFPPSVVYLHEKVSPVDLYTDTPGGPVHVGKLLRAAHGVEVDIATFDAATRDYWVPEIDAVSGTGALSLMAGALALAGERRRRKAA
jgi:hypothetical protein